MASEEIPFDVSMTCKISDDEYATPDNPSNKVIKEMRFELRVMVYIFWNCLGWVCETSRTLCFS